MGRGVIEILTAKYPQGRLKKQEFCFFRRPLHIFINNGYDMLV